jgi:hypothetical protein
MAQGSLFAEYPRGIGEFGGCAGLRIDGSRSAARAFLGCRSAGWCWMDAVCFRTLGSGAARDARLGAWPHERHSNHGFAGGLALGGVIWGYAVATTGTTYTLLGAAVLFLISLALARPLSINFTGTLNFDPAPVTTFSHRLIYTPEPHDGPMSITVEFKVDCAHGREFINLMREVRLIHLRNGAYSWRLDEDITRPNTLRLEMIVPSWNEHLLQKERMTKAEKELLEKASSLHIGTTAPEERIYLSVNKDLFTPRQCDYNPPSLPKSPADQLA